MEDKHKFYLTANIDMCDETADLKKEAASVINLPVDGDKQPDLSYFSAILVSSGENLNHAYFLGSELVAAADTIVSKALDVEHEEQEIIGHLYSYAFTDKEHKKLNITELASTETATLDTKDMHIQVGSIVYKNRFPEIAEDIANKKYKVSMECYYQDFDIKVGEVIIPKTVANSLGIEISNADIFGKSGKIIKEGKEIASGTVARVLRGICFSGCGIVENPANPPSVILETANQDENESNEIVFDLDIINVSSKELEDIDDVLPILKEIEEESSKLSDLPFDKIKAATVLYVDKFFKAQYSDEEMTNSLIRLENALKKAKDYKTEE